ncbi:MAG: hypothetical protein KF787_09400 [Phycisphaeraceae bacterium]|nr:hypothetical protein [Phycisphaerae bacterium]MBX3392848.1 hypothetical protein [Phycisphaeraceae bacterium]
MKILRTFTILAAALALSLSALAARADTLKLRDGRTLEGTVTREVDGYIWFSYKVGDLVQERMFAPSEIVQLSRGTADASPIEEAPVGGAAATADPAAKPETTDFGRVRRLAILTGEGMVGMQMAAKPLEDAIPLLQQEGVTDVVYKVNSGGGYLLEIQKISDVLHFKYKPLFRTVAWIESAISAAAMSSYCLEEIYFMPNGNFGGCTGWSGSLDAVKGRGLEEVLLAMERISARANRNPAIMRAMQISGSPDVMQQLGISPPSGELSANIDPRTGEVTWFQDQSGKHVLNPKHGVMILTFDALEAEKFKFSRGTVRTHDELARQMGYTEYVFVGKPVRGVAWPVSKAEEAQIEWRRGISEAQARFGEIVTSYQAAVQQAQSSQDKTIRGSFINRARGHLNSLRNIAKRFPIFVMFYNLNPDFFEEQEEMLRRLAR